MARASSNTGTVRIAGCATNTIARPKFSPRKLTHTIRSTCIASPSTTVSPKTRIRARLTNSEPSGSSPANGFRNCWPGSPNACEGATRMAATNRGTFLSGAGLVWRWQRLVWWVFFVSLIFGFFSTQEMTERASSLLDHNTAAQRLVKGFDISAIVLLQQLPDSPLEIQGHNIVHFSMLFVVFMLFATGGILSAYVLDEKPTTTAFFEAAGHHFWRFFRLLIYLAIVLLPIAGLAAATNAIYTHVEDTSISPYPGDHVVEAAAIVILLLLIIVRVWFDMAQVIAVADDEKKMHRALRRAFTLFRHNFFSLLWLYLRVSIIEWLLFALGLHVWMFHLNPQSAVAAFLVSQLMILTWIGTRLWQRASEAIWYRNYQANHAAAPAWSPAPEPMYMPVAAPAPQQ